MTRDEIDILWNRAMAQSVKDGEMFTRYHFAALIATYAEKLGIIDMAIENGGAA